MRQGQRGLLQGLKKMLSSHRLGRGSQVLFNALEWPIGPLRSLRHFHAPDMCLMGRTRPLCRPLLKDFLLRAESFPHDSSFRWSAKRCVSCPSDSCRRQLWQNRSSWPNPEVRQLTKRAAPPSATNFGCRRRRCGVPRTMHRSSSGSRQVPTRWHWLNRNKRRSRHSPIQERAART
jgi:hypothetical protein